MQGFVVYHLGGVCNHIQDRCHLVDDVEDILEGDHYGLLGWPRGY